MMIFILLQMEMEDKVIVGTIVGDNYEINNDSIELFSSVKNKITGRN